MTIIVVGEVIMGDNAIPVITRGERIDHAVSEVTQSIHQAAQFDGNVDYGEVTWSIGPRVSYDFERQVVFALAPDLYIGPEERAGLLRDYGRQYNHDVAEALLNHLTARPPLFTRAEYVKAVLSKKGCASLKNLWEGCTTNSTRSELRKEVREKLRPALERAVKDPNPEVADQARYLIEELNKK